MCCVAKFAVNTVATAGVVIVCARAPPSLQERNCRRVPPVPVVAGTLMLCVDPGPLQHLRRGQRDSIHHHRADLRIRGDGHLG